MPHSFFYACTISAIHFKAREGSRFQCASVKHCEKSQNHNQKLVWHVKVSKWTHSEDVFVCESTSEEHVSVRVQASAFSFCFLLFFRKQGALNFFFFLDGDLEGEPSGVLPEGLLGGAVGGVEGGARTGGVVSEVSVVDRAFICFSSSSCCFFSSPLSFCTASVAFPSVCDLNEHSANNERKRQLSIGQDAQGWNRSSFQF